MPHSTTATAPSTAAVSLGTKTPAQRQQARQQAMARRPPTAAQLVYLVSLGDQAAPPGSMWDASKRIDALQRGEEM